MVRAIELVTMSLMAKDLQMYLIRMEIGNFMCQNPSQLQLKLGHITPISWVIVLMRGAIRLMRWKTAHTIQVKVMVFLIPLATGLGMSLKQAAKFLLLIFYHRLSNKTPRL